jgi:hypothetical protein
MTNKIWAWDYSIVAITGAFLVILYGLAISDSPWKWAGFGFSLVIYGFVFSIWIQERETWMKKEAK